MQRLYKKHTSKQLVHTPSLLNDVAQKAHTDTLRRFEGSHRVALLNELQPVRDGEFQRRESSVDLQSLGRLIDSVSVQHVTCGTLHLVSEFLVCFNSCF